LTPEKSAPIKMWTKGVPVEEAAKEQLIKTASLPIIFKHLAVMPDVHYGLGSTVGSVIPTQKAIIPAAVGVDLGCGMMAVKTSLVASDLPDNLKPLRIALETAIPHGRSGNGKRKKDVGAWDEPPKIVDRYWAKLEPRFKALTDKYPRFIKTNNYKHLGTLGTGNHFVEVCLDLEGGVWIMLHSGSRGVGNAIGSYFIEIAKKEMEQHLANLPDANLAYLEEGSQYFNDYVNAVEWAQEYARFNREVMMHNAILAMRSVIEKTFTIEEEAVNCHHNYVEKETHFGEEIYVTRKGAVSARKGELGIIPGSMGAKSYIVRGLGNETSFCSCSHGAGRVMSRTQAKKRFSLEDHKRATEGVECRKDRDVIDETPMAYKDIDAVMAAQQDLVEVVYQLKQIVCVKG
ncbi:MAG: RtcB family protein, partial [Xanthomonadaceae bacterium]|nr:RtcB family protein [Xanthomonadaceae bacterium]